MLALSQVRSSQEEVLRFASNKLVPAAKCMLPGIKWQCGAFISARPGEGGPESFSDKCNGISKPSFAEAQLT